MPPAATPPPASATMSSRPKPGNIGRPAHAQERKAIAARIPICAEALAPHLGQVDVEGHRGLALLALVR